MMRPRRKRSHQEQPDASFEDNASVFMDDLAVAAGYAVATTANPLFVTTSSDAAATQNEEEIALDDDDSTTEKETKNEREEDDDEKETFASSTSTDRSDEQATDQQQLVRDDDNDDEARHDKKPDDDDDDDDDESDVDLTQELERMTQDATMDDDEDGGVDRPKTVHEIDAYQVDASQLKQQFGLNVTLKEEQDDAILLLQQLKDQQQNAKLQVAGILRHHMASERTMVIQSAGSDILEEGTLLIIRIPDDSGTEKTVLLGRILEIFGPVSQPLYSIRIPEPLPDTFVESAAVTNNNHASTDAAGAENAADEQGADKPSKNPSATKAHDPWAEQGEYTLKLKEQPGSWTVFYPPEAATMLDCRAIFKSSARGCDASNVFDEEIANPNDLDYSDDEQERIAKRRGKPGSKQQGGKVPSGRGSAAAPRTFAPRPPHRSFPQRQAPPPGFHAMASMPPAEQATYMMQPQYPPQQLHHPPHQQPYYQQQQYQQFPFPQQQQFPQQFPYQNPQYYPPQPQYLQQQQCPQPYPQQYPGVPGTTYVSQYGVPPPPPPPPQPEEPDTVYYDMG